MPVNAPYPWQQQAWQQLMRALDNGRFPHALLLTAPAGAGGEAFAEALVARLLEADGNDRMQTLLEAGTHPDQVWLEPEEAGKAIKVDAIRKLIDFVNLTAQYGHYKVAVIQPAEAMNRSAANSLLKTLEEPPPQCVLILVSRQPALLPITIRSRCQRLDLTPGTDPATVDWLRERSGQPDPALLLAIAGGAPLAACELADEQGLPLRDRLIADLEALGQGKVDPVNVAGQWVKLEPLQVYRWLYSLTRDLVRCRMSGPETVVNRDQGQRLQRLTHGRSLRQVVNIYELVIKNYNLLTGPYSPNAVVLLEDFIFSWQDQLLTEVGQT